MIDANRIWPLLWIGSKPEPGVELAAAGFHVLVLCAKQYQPPASAFQVISRKRHVVSAQVAQPQVFQGDAGLGFEGQDCFSL